MDRIYLVGPPYSGKTTTGSYLAGKLGWKFIDLDEYIEQRLSKSIAKIFEEEGEEMFRNYESKFLREVSENKRVIISCGGGTPEIEENMVFMLEKGFTIFLNTAKSELYARMATDKGERPLFKGKTMVEKQQELARLVEKRFSNYSKAKLVWNTETQTNRFYNAVNQLVNIYSRAC